MNDDRKFERIARTWLELGPTDAPGHVVNSALLAIESTAQERDLWLPWRTLRMTNTVRLATAAILAILAIGGGFLLVGRPATQVGHPSPSASESPLSTVQPFASTVPGPAAFALALQSRWTSVGDRSQPPGGYPFGATMVIGPTGVRIWAFKADIESTWSASAPDRRLAVRLVASQRVLTAGHWDCRPGQDGSYTASLSASGATLTLVAIADACATRAGILAGAWTRTPCDSTDDRCNELAAGRHDSTVLLPGDDVAAPFITSYSYDVPAGWTSELLGAGTLFRLADGMEINLRFDLAPRSQTTGCPEIAAAGEGTSAAAIAAWLRAVPGVTATPPTAVLIGGYSGVMLDLSVDTSSTSGVCRASGGGNPAIFVFKHPGSPSPLPTVYGPGYRSRYVILDLPGDHNLLIDVTTPDQQSFDEFVPAAMPIIDAFQFTSTGP